MLSTSSHTSHITSSTRTLYLPCPLPVGGGCNGIEPVRHHGRPVVRPRVPYHPRTEVNDEPGFVGKIALKRRRGEEEGRKEEGKVR